MRRKKARNLAKKIAVVFFTLLFLSDSGLVSAASLYSIAGGSDFWGGFFPAGEQRSVVKDREINPVSEVAKRAGGFISPLDQESGEIVNETCDVVRSGTESKMRCSRTPRFRQIDGAWQTFSEAATELFSENQLRFSVAGKTFALRPYIVQKGKRKYIDELSKRQAKKLGYRVEFDAQNRFTKWTSYFENDGSISESGYTLVTNLLSRFVESRDNGKLTALNLILDDSIQVSFDDLVSSGFTIDRRDNDVAITGFGTGEVSLDPSLFFFSTAAVDGYIKSADCTSGTIYDIYTTSTVASVGEDHYSSCAGATYNDDRMYLSFDTSALSDSITITSATLNIYANSYTYWKYAPSTWDIDYYMGTDDIGASLDSGDWGAVGSYDGTLDWAGSTGWKAYAIASPTNVSINGDTDFELRYAWTPNGSDRYSWANGRMSEYTGVSSDPYLEIGWGEYWGNQFITSTASSMGNLNGSTLRSAISFTALSTQKVTAIRLYLHAVSSSPTYRFGIQSDSSGDPSGTWLSGSGASSYVDVAPTSTGWNVFTFAANAQPSLTAGTAYHIVVQYVSGTIGGSNYIGIRRQTPNNLMTPYRNVSDSMQNTEWYNGSAWSNQGYQPIYFIDATTDEGNSNTTYTNWAIYVNYSRAEKITVYGPSKKADTVGFYIQKAGTCGSIPTGDLTYDIRDSSDTQLATGTVVTAAAVTTTLTWYDVALSSTVDLKTGQTYRVQLTTSASTACYYQTTSNYSYVAAGGDYYNLNYNATASRGGYCTTTCTSDANWTYYDYYDIDFRFNVSNIFSPYSQNWRMYGDEDVATPVVPYAAENTIPPDKIGKKEPIKLRLSIAELGGAGEDNIRFRLQYSTSSTFATATNVVEVGLCSFSIWCYYNGDNATDDGTIASRVLSDTDTSGTYNESGTTSSTFDLTADKITEFEFTIWGNNPAASTTYYFRAYDTVNSQAVAINPTGGFSYPYLTTTATFSLSDNGPASVAFTDYTLGTAGDSTKSLLQSNSQEIEVWDDRGTGVGWSAVATLEHLRSITTGSFYSQSTNGLPTVQLRNIAATVGGIIVVAYNDGTSVRFKKSSDKTATWSEAITGSPLGAGESSSIPATYMDASENIHLCYERGDSINYRLLTKSGTQWSMGSEETVVAAGGGILYTECSIVAESDGDLMVAVKGASAANGIAVYRKPSGGSWASSWSWAMTNDDPSLVLYANDKVMLLYRNSGNNLSYDTYTGSWNGAAQIDTADPNNGFSAVGDSGGNVYLTYVETVGISDTGKIRFRRYNGSWASEDTIYDGSVIGSTGSNPSITTDGTSLWVFYNVTDADLNRYLYYTEYDGSAWHNAIYIGTGTYAYLPHTPLQVNRNQFYLVYGLQTGASTYTATGWYNHDLIRAGDVTFDPNDTVTALYAAELGSCPSAGVCAAASNTLDPDSSITIVDADACTTGCPGNPSYGMGKYYIEPVLTIGNLNLRRIGDYSGTLTITIS
ncbi:MAG: hypothetical protein WC497_05915 [Patescibacteria group bacterium]